jgi:hypothetical protein
MVWVGDYKLSIGVMVGFTIGRVYNIHRFSNSYCSVIDNDGDGRYMQSSWFISIKEYRRRKLLKISGRRL